MKVVTYTSSQKLNCSTCFGDVVVCVEEELTKTGVPWIVMQSSSVTEKVQFGRVYYEYTFLYDEINLEDESYDLVAGDINGVLCKGCLTDYIESVIAIGPPGPQGSS